MVSCVSQRSKTEVLLETVAIVPPGNIRANVFLLAADFDSRSAQLITEKTKP